jgi:uncharacterized protein (DUF488 family)
LKIFTIGFKKKSAENFFSKLKQADVKRLIDVRLNNISQLAGFTKRDDLRYFAKTICGIDYIHLSVLAPTKDLLDEYKKKGGDWSIYEKKFIELMAERKIEFTMQKDLLDGSCLLCSEEKAAQCHRRLVAEYLRDKWGDVQIHHIE